MSIPENKKYKNIKEDHKLYKISSGNNLSNISVNHFKTWCLLMHHKAQIATTLADINCRKSLLFMTWWVHLSNFNITIICPISPWFMNFLLCLTHMLSINTTRFYYHPSKFTCIMISAYKCIGTHFHSTLLIPFILNVFPQKL